MHRQVIDVAKRAGVTRGRRFRIDTTVVETNVHYPTDSTLLQDGVRVLTRTMQQASTAMGDQPGRIRNRLRSVIRRVLIIGYQARSPKTRDALIESYRKLTATTRAVLRDVDTMVRRIAQRRRTAADRAATILDRARAHLQDLRPLVERVVHQTRARLLGGDTHVPDKVLSLFEPHTTTIRKGKISKPNEFGNLVTIQESEQQIITAYEVHTGRPADVTLWTAALDRHHARLRPRPASGRGRSRLQLGDQRTGGHRSWRATRRAPPARAEVREPTRLRTASLVPARPTVAGRLRRAHQCDQTAPWTPTLSLSWRRRHASLGRPWGHRRQLDQHGDGPRPPGGRVTPNRRDRRAPSHPQADELTPAALARVISSPEISWACRPPCIMKMVRSSVSRPSVGQRRATVVLRVRPEIDVEAFGTLHWCL